MTTKSHSSGPNTSDFTCKLQNCLGHRGLGGRREVLLALVLVPVGAVVNPFNHHAGNIVSNARAFHL